MNDEYLQSPQLDLEPLARDDELLRNLYFAKVCQPNKGVLPLSILVGGTWISGGAVSSTGWWTLQDSESEDPAMRELLATTRDQFPDVPESADDIEFMYLVKASTPGIQHNGFVRVRFDQIQAWAFGKFTLKLDS